MPRLGEAGAQDSQLSARFSFSQLEGRVAIDGALRGVVTLTCQRCLRALEFPLEETFQVVLVQDEAELAEEPGGYEPVLADPARFDLQALAEDQALLALPLVPRHEPGQCNPSGAVQVEPEIDESGTQKPFGNLRDLMRGR
ncbi:MAG TPA: YceD family protein [Povalibacter sp.]|nr:YceD family protein [Povalibacter sp.]